VVAVSFWRFRLAPRQKSIASRTVDFPLSPGPIRQLTPGAGSQIISLMQRKFSIVILRMRWPTQSSEATQICIGSHLMQATGTGLETVTLLHPSSDSHPQPAIRPAKSIAPNVVGRTDPLHCGSSLLAKLMVQPAPRMPSAAAARACPLARVWLASPNREQSLFPNVGGPRRRKAFDAQAF
jgi:hypothetical protein